MAARLELAQHPGSRVGGGFVAVAFMASSESMLYLAQRDIRIGTVYAIWTGIGAAGTFVVGIARLGDRSFAARLVEVAMIVNGVITFKVASA